MTIGLATSSELPELDPDCQPLLHALRARGIDARPVIWDDPGVNWAALDLVVIQSTWDYHGRRDEFLRWTEHVASVSRLLNPAEVIRWNTEKLYLQAFADQGIPCVPTVWIPQGTTLNLQAAMAEKGWSEAILKPTISAGSVNTFRVTSETISDCQTKLEQLKAEKGMMLQPYLKEIETRGELSMIYFEGRFSHAVLKTPATGDFRIQEKYGGTTQPTEASEKQQAFGRHVMDAVGQGCLYGRVDVLCGPDSDCRLMELELVEPNLYLKYAPGSAENLSKIIENRLVKV